MNYREKWWERWTHSRLYYNGMTPLRCLQSPACPSEEKYGILSPALSAVWIRSSMHFSHSSKVQPISVLSFVCLCSMGTWSFYHWTSWEIHLHLLSGSRYFLSISDYNYFLHAPPPSLSPQRNDLLRRKERKDDIASPIPLSTSLQYPHPLFLPSLQCNSLLGTYLSNHEFIEYRTRIGSFGDRHILHIQMVQREPPAINQSITSSLHLPYPLHTVVHSSHLHISCTVTISHSLLSREFPKSGAGFSPERENEIIISFRRWSTICHLSIPPSYIFILPTVIPFFISL